jgi:DNA-binding transcriptional ArsR family regulator
MARALHHPSREQLALSAVLEALSDPVRRRIAVRLAQDGEDRCSAFLDCASKANLTYHFARLREAGLIRVRLEGPYRYVSLRGADIEARFPGLLPAVIGAARRESRRASR